MTDKRDNFKKRMVKLHSAIKVNTEANENEIIIPENVKICIKDNDEVIRIAVMDLIDFLNKAFKINAEISDTEGFFTFSVNKDKLKDVKGYMGRRTVVTKSGVEIFGFDNRGTAQGIYSLEDRMKERQAPYLEVGDTEHIIEFSPKMVHSGYGLDQFPDEYLSACAHNGYDAIIVFVKDATHSAHGECDFNDIITRAKKYGIDVYAYSYFMNFMHPEDEGAKEKYREVYGGLFEKLPGLKGMIFVGESIEFPSKDPHVVPLHHRMTSPDGLPRSKPYPGWWPCYDYKDWIALVRDSIRAVSPEADVVFWTYNFGYVVKEERIKLLESLPTDISLLVTFEMFDSLQHENSVGKVRDYTVSHIGPSEAFVSEAEVAKRRGIRLYSQANTAGRTWDYGTAPYEPFPYQWNKRNEALLKAKRDYGLVGLMESHHYGFYPSFISMLAKDTFTKNSRPFLDRLYTYGKNLCGEPEKFLEGMKYIDQAVSHCTPSHENQYGPMRIGPAFPFCLKTAYKMPSEEGSLFGNKIYITLNDIADWDILSAYSVRVLDEINEHKKAIALYKKGIGILKTVKKKNAEFKRLKNLCEYLMRCHITAKNFKEFDVYRKKLLASTTRKEVVKYAEKIKVITERERENALKTIPIVRKDSALGFEASMGHPGDEQAILWKLKHLDLMLKNELSIYLNK